MKQFIVSILFIGLSFTSFAQATFDQGYFIDNSNQKITCLIKNNNPKNNPTKVEYKKANDDKLRKLNIQDIKEFGIGNEAKYIRRNVKIDRSSSKVDDLSSSKVPKLKEEVLFLKVIVEGKASFYSYTEGNLVRFFYKKEDNKIEQLVYKLYNKNGKLGENKMFKTQIWEALQCPGLKVSMLEGLKYEQKSLTKFFIIYNEYNNSKSIIFRRPNQKIFHFTVRPRINYTSFDITHDFLSINYSFGRKASWGLGTELEFVFPFYKNTWTVAVEPNFQQFRATNKDSTNTRLRNANYNSIEIPTSVRHYFFLNDKSSVFVNGAFIIDLGSLFGLGFSESPNGNSILIDTDVGFNFGAGVGFKYNNRYSMELRYATKKDVFSRVLTWRSEYTYFSFILGYSFY